MFGWWGYVTLPFLSFYYELSFYAIYLHFTSDCYPCRFYFFYFLPYVYLSMLKISVALKRGIFKDWKKKSSGFKCRNLFPILYSREYVASLDQFGGDILISFIYLFLPYGEKPKLFFATHYLKLCWRFIKYFFKLDYIQSKHSIYNELCNKPPNQVLRKIDHP